MYDDHGRLQAFAFFFSEMVLFSLWIRVLSVHHRTKLLISSRKSSHSNPSDDGGVIEIFYSTVLSMSWIAVVGVQCEQEGLSAQPWGGGALMYNTRVEEV